MTTYPPAEYRPDDAGPESPFTDNIVGLLPTGRGAYKPFPEVELYSAAAASGVVLSSATVRTSAGINRLFIAGDGFVEELNSSLTWDDVTPAAGFTATDGVQFTRFKGDLVLLSDTNDPVKIDIDAGTQFGPFSGTPPAAKYGGFINEHYILAGWQATPNRLQWSGINGLGSWTVGTNLSGTKTFPDGSEITGICSGFSDGIVFLRNRIELMTLTGGNPAFSFTPISEEIGCIAPASIVCVGRSVYFYSIRGFCRLNSDYSIDYIGEDRVDETVEDAMDDTLLPKLKGAADPLEKFVWWTFYGTGSASAYANKGVGFHWHDSRWFPADGLNSSHIGGMGTAPVSLEDLDTIFGPNLDTDVPFSLDSNVLKGNRPSLALFGSDNNLYFFTGANKAAQIDSQEIKINEHGAATLQSVQVISDNNNWTAAAGYKTLPGDSFSYGSDRAAEAATGVINFSMDQTNGHFHRARLKIAAGETWSRLRGVLTPKAQPGGSV